MKNPIKVIYLQQKTTCEENLITFIHISLNWHELTDVLPHLRTEMHNTNAHMATNKHTYISKCRTAAIYQIPTTATLKINEFSSKEN